MVAMIVLYLAFSFVIGIVTGKFLALITRGLVDVESAIKEVSETSTPF